MSMPRRSGWRRALALAAAAVLVIGLAGVLAWEGIVSRGAVADQADEDAPVAPPERVSVQGGEAVVTLDPQDQRKDGIRTAPLKLQSFVEQVEAYGSVLDPKALTELADQAARAAAQVQIARARLAASQTAFTRAQHLYRDAHNMSEAQLQAAEAAFQIDAAEAFVRRDDGARSPLRFVSPAPRTDPRIQGRSFLYTAPADSGLLPGMSVVACLADGRAREGAAIPASAIVWGQGRAWAYFRTGSRTFARRAVATDWPAPGDGYVVRDERQGTDVVVEGAQMLFSEESRAQLQTDD